MRRGDIVIIMENSGRWDKQDFYGRVGEYLFTDYDSAVVEVSGESARIICNPENLVRASAVPRIFEALCDALEWLENHGGDELPSEETGLTSLIKTLESALKEARGQGTAVAAGGE